MQLAGSAAVVTGGASGLGAATACRLAEAGATVTLIDRDAELAATTAAKIGHGTQFAAADVTDEGQLATAIDEAGARRPLRVSVNCAGIAIAHRTLNRDGTPHPLDSFQRIIEVNLLGTFNSIRLAAAAMAKADPTTEGERGVIVNTASVAAYEGQIGQAAYAASKGGVVALTLPAARDLAPVGIRVCTIAPGVMDTPLLGGLPEEATQALAKDTVFPKRLGTPDEYARLALHIIENPYLNGATVRLDAALRMPPR